MRTRAKGCAGKSVLNEAQAKPNTGEERIG